MRLTRRLCSSYFLSSPQVDASYILRFSGFSHKLPNLVMAAVPHLRSPVFSPATFERVKESYVRALKSQFSQAPIQQACILFGIAARTHTYHHEELLHECGSITEADVRAFIASLFVHARVSFVVHGNLPRAAAKSVAEQFYAALGCQQAFDGAMATPRTVMLPRGETIVVVARGSNPAEPNSAVTSRYQIEMGDLRFDAICNLLNRATSDSTFDTLRTKEQLGYMVHSYVAYINFVNTFCINVQSLRAPDYLDGRIEAYIEQVLLPNIRVS